MSAGPGPAGARGAPLALPLRAGIWRRPNLRRRAALGVALLALAVLAVHVATGGGALPSALRRAPARLAALLRPAFTTAMAGRQASPAPAAPGAELRRERTQPSAARRDSGRRSVPDRVVAPADASALFAPHSWFVAPPPPPPAAPPPPPEPAAPPLPYALVGSFAPEGAPPVFFLTRGDRVIDARVGDRLDGVYQVEAAAGDQLVLVYLPLNVRQNVPARVSR